MKRTIVLFLCLALALSLFAGCRAYMPFPRLPGEDPTTEPAPETEPATTEAPRPLTAEEILETALERLRSADTLALDLRGSFRAAGRTNGDENAVELELELPGALMAEPRIFRGDGSLSMKFDEEEKDTVAFSLCFAVEEGKPALYFRSEEDEIYERVVLSDGKGEAQTGRPDLTAVAWDLEAEETAYVLTHALTAEEAERLWSAAMRDEDVDLVALEALGLDEDSFRSVFLGMKLELRVDRETMELRAFTVDLSEGMETLFAQIMERMQERSEEDVVLELTDVCLVLSLELHDYDGVAPFEAPEDYEELGDLSELLYGLGGDPEIVPGPVLEELDDSYGLEDYDFRLSEITPRDILEQGWVVTDAVSMEGELAEDGTAAPGALVQIYLKQEGHEADAWNPLRLGVVNTGEAPADPLDCPVFFFSVNETPFYEQSEEGMVDFSGPGGVERGMDQAQIEALLGTPYYESAETEALMKCIYYYTARGEALALLLDQNGALQAMFYQDYARYDPSDYVFHN